MPDSPYLTVLVATCNNGPLLQTTLASFAWADRLLVLDGGSTDNTLAIAETYHASVCYHPGNRPTTEPIGMILDSLHALVETPWVLLVSPGDYADEAFRLEMQGKLAGLPETIRAGSIPFLRVFLNRRLCYGRQRQKPKVVLYRKDALKTVLQALYAQPSEAMGTAFPLSETNRFLAPGEIIRFNSGLMQAPYSNETALFKGMLAAAEQGAWYLAQTHGQRPPFLGLRRNLVMALIGAKIQFIYRYFFRLGCLDGFAGFLVAMADACQSLLKAIQYRALMSRSNGTLL